MAWTNIADGEQLSSARTKINALGNQVNSPVYAEIYVEDNTTAQSIPTGATYTKVINFGANGLSSGCTADEANNKITITQTGKYKVDGSVSFTCATNGVEFKMVAFLNGVEKGNLHFHNKVGTAGDKLSGSFSGYINVTAVPWDLDLRARHDNGGSVNLTLDYCNLNCHRVGD